jgi:hypothetical protein
MVYFFRLMLLTLKVKRITDGKNDIAFQDILNNL